MVSTGSSGTLPYSPLVIPWLQEAMEPTQAVRATLKKLGVWAPTAPVPLWDTDPQPHFLLKHKNPSLARPVWLSG